MMKRTVLVTAALVSSVLVGCGSEGGAEDGTDEQVDAADAEGQDPDGDIEAGDIDAGDDVLGVGSDAPDDDGDGASPLGEVAIGQTQTHINGAELTIRSLRVEQNAIFVDIEAFNGSSRNVLLAGFRLAVAIDDTGKEYRYEPPEDNTSLRIESNGTLDGSIAFVGRVGADASSLTVQFNYHEGEPRSPSDADHRLTDAPSFEFADLPLPGG